MRCAFRCDGSERRLRHESSLNAEIELSIKILLRKFSENSPKQFAFFNRDQRRLYYASPPSPPLTSADARCNQQHKGTKELLHSCARAYDAQGIERNAWWGLARLSRAHARKSRTG